MTSIAPLRGQPLRYLNVESTRLTDLTPLLECTELEDLRARDSPAPIEPFRGHKSLRIISYGPGNLPESRVGRPVELFWKAYDAQPKPAGKK